MRAITVRQPWAWAIIHGGKDVENRTRNIAGAYRGPIAIHAGLAFDDAGTWEDGPCEDLLLDWFKDNQDDPATYPWRHRGAIIGVADLVDVHQSHDEYGMRCGGLDDLYAGHFCSPWALSGHFHLALANPRPLATPVRARGFLGLWTLPADVEAAVLAQIGGTR